MKMLWLLPSPICEIDLPDDIPLMQEDIYFLLAAKTMNDPHIKFTNNYSITFPFSGCLTTVTVLDSIQRPHK